MFFNQSTGGINEFATIKATFVHVLNPLDFQRENGFTYLVAHSDEQGSVRNFRLDRIKSVTPTGSHFTEVQQSSGQGDEKLALSFTVDRSRRTVAELFGIGPIPQSGEIEVSVFSSDWAKKAVIAHSPDLRLNQPEELRIEIRNNLQNSLALYAP